MAVVTSDTLNSPEKAAQFVAEAEAGAIDVIVGTQLVTKGFHFPELTLVGVVDADLGLEGGDLRAAERTYQQVAQVAGRAGRGAKPGEVLIQTRHPDALGDRRARRRRPRRVLRRRDRSPPPRRRAAVRPLGGDHRLVGGRSRSARGGATASAPPGRNSTT